MRKSRRTLASLADSRDAAGRPSKLDVVGGTPSPPQSTPAADAEQTDGPNEWLSERDFTRTLELVDRTCQELRASETRAEQLRAQLDEARRRSEEQLEAAYERIRCAEERALLAEERARHAVEMGSGGGSRH
jgi:hypothetical protein